MSSSTLTHTPPAGTGRGQAEPHLFLVCMTDTPLARPARWSLADVHQVVIGRGAERKMSREVDGKLRRLTIHVPDGWMSQNHATFEATGPAWNVCDAGSKNGTSVNGVVEKARRLADGDVIHLGHTFFVFREAVVPQPEGESQVQEEGAFATLDPELEAEFRQIVQAAAVGAEILIGGETGTGKGEAAKAVHQASGRGKGPFVAVNCGALPAHLVESELFGSTKGAFTGATADRPGLIRSAHRGTLFLDEIGDLPLASQAVLLQVLQDRAVRPVGSASAIPVDLHVISATHQDLRARIDEKTFRADLYARLSGFRFAMPSLRDRCEDVGLLIAAVLRTHFPDRAASLRLTAEAGLALLLYDWPLNVRELEKALRSAVALAGEAAIEPKHLPEEVRDTLSRAPVAAGRSPASAAPGDVTPVREAHKEERRQQIIAVLHEHKGVVSEAARAMGQHRRQLQRWIADLGIRPDEFKD